MISGKPGLFKILGKRPQGLILAYLDGTNKKLSTSPTQKISILSDIAIFTQDGEKPLREVFLSLKKEVDGGFVVPQKKDPESDLTDLMKKIVPDYDTERVYISDMRKLVSWWHLLVDKLDFDSLQEPETQSEEATTTAESAPNTPKKAAPKSTPGAKANTKGKGVKTVTNRKQS